MAEHLVNLHILRLEQKIHSRLERSESRIKVHPHKVCKAEPALCSSGKYQRSLVKARYRLSRGIIIGKQTSAVRVSLKGNGIKLCEQLVHIGLLSHQLVKLLKDIYPGIYLGGTVVAVYHCDQGAVRGRYKIDLGIYFGKLLLKHYHCKYRGSGGNITCPLRYAVGGDHSGSGISLGRANRYSCLKLSRRIKKLCSLFGKLSGIGACR